MPKPNLSQMIRQYLYTTSYSFLLLLLMISSCSKPPPHTSTSPPLPAISQQPPRFVIKNDIPIRTYFEFMDSMVHLLDSLLTYPINEYLIVRTNPWIIDTLENTDYYRLMEKGQFVYDPQSLIALRKGDTLVIPDSTQVSLLQHQMNNTWIDINIPEFKLRIKEFGKTIFSFPVRVGRVEMKFLEMAGQEVDLRTRTGIGKIVRVERDPVYINPSDNKIYKTTGRDDGKRTKLPRIPWIEPELNGQRFGQLIHPTTNPVTLGKAYSNGCIGMREADMWRVYYYAPVGTKVEVRYDLEVVNEWGDTLKFRDIYPRSQKQEKYRSLDAVALITSSNKNIIAPLCDCRARLDGNEL